MERRQRGAEQTGSGSAAQTRGLWRIDGAPPSDDEGALRALQERVKELNCLYGVAQLVERHEDSMASLLAELVDFLPLWWQWPKRTVARITCEGETYRSRRFREGTLRQAAAIVAGGRQIGEIEVFVHGPRAGKDGLPFLREEEVMLREVAARVGAAAARLETRRQLAAEQEALQQANSALRTVLARIEEEKIQICRDVHANIEKVVFPVLDTLCLKLRPEDRKYAELLRRSMGEVASPLLGRLPPDSPGLSPVETTICSLIRSGLSSKEIAELRNVSLSTVLRQRERIRQKLKIRNKKTNLSTLLRSHP